MKSSPLAPLMFHRMIFIDLVGNGGLPSLSSNMKKSSVTVLHRSWPKRVERATEVASKLGFDGVECVPPSGREGGVWVMLKNKTDLVNFSGSSHRYFHGLFHFGVNEPEVLVTCIHAPATTSYKNRMWDEFADDIPPSPTPHLVVGDLNEVVSQTEKMGGRRVAATQGAALTRWMDKAGLVDLGFEGTNFTWNNGQEGISMIRERLDRALANIDWLKVYPNTTQGGGYGGCKV